MIKNIINCIKDYRVALFGGSFNPIHNGHLSLVNSACSLYGIDLVIFIPGFKSSRKKQLQFNFTHRYKMTEILVNKYSNFDILESNIIRSKINYSVDVIEIFYKNFSCFSPKQLYLIVGYDWKDDIRLWYKFNYIASKANIIIGFKDLDNHIKTDYYDPFLIQNYQSIRSSSIVNNIHNTEYISKFMDQDIVSYITKNKLYQ